jgi:uncharacterized protein YprB with RNaseH-like and TPR domain
MHKIEQMNQELQTRLRQLGVMKGVRHLRAAPAPSPAVSAPPSAFGRGFTFQSQADDEGDEIIGPVSLEQLIPGGRLEETAGGACFVVDRVYPLSYQHGQDRLSDLLNFSPDLASSFIRDDRLASLDFRDFLFLDTETTGLAGAGVLAFMVGVAFFEPAAGEDVLVVRQYFLRDHGDELAMLHQLEALLAVRAGLITFNGRSFDLPLLDNRFLLNRLRTSLTERPHIDLLPPARRLWRARLGSCALGSLETTLLGLQRSQEDVPGWLIPSLYYDYLRSRDARPITRVFYHNQMDMLSMVTLAGRMMRQLAHVAADDHPVDLYSLARWQVDLGLTAEAERNLLQCALGDLPLELYHDALFRLATLYRRSGRRGDAVRLWEQIAATSMDNVAAHLELAKHFEWHERDIATAVAWTERALALVAYWGDTAQARLTRDELSNRLARLLKKSQI